MNTYITANRDTRCVGPRVDAHSFESAQEAIEVLYGDTYIVVGQLQEIYPVDPELIRFLTEPQRVSDNVVHLPHHY